jgi:adhesin transport system outer membrane protein
MSVLSSQARADDELLQFQQVAPRSTVGDIAADQQKPSAAQVGAEQSASPSAVVQSVRESLALPAPGSLVEDVLVFERLPVARVDAPNVPDEPAAAMNESGAAPILQLSVPQSVPGGTIAAARVAGKGEVPEAELREMFLSMVDAAAGRSPAVAGALAQYGASKADISEAKGQRYPQLEISARGLSREFGATAASGTADPSLTLGVTTTLFDWGRLRKTIESRTHLADAADFAVQAQLESSAYDVTSNLVELAKQRIVVETSQRYVDRMAELVKMLEGIVAVDAGRVSELTQARARLLQAEASRSTAESKTRDIEINLRRMVGDRVLPSLPRSQYWEMRLPELNWLIAESLHHPTVAQAKASARSADTQADAVRSALRPQVNWVVSKSTGEDIYGRESAWQSGLTLSWGAFRGGSGRASEQAARQRAQAGWMGAEQQIQDLEYRIRAANQDARSLADRADLYRGLSLESDKIRAAFYEQWYHLGRRTLLDVLSSESEHYNNQIGEVSSRFDGYQAVVRQYASAGTLVRWLSSGK